MQQANPHLFVQYDQWIQQQLARMVQRVLSMPEIHHIAYNVQTILQRDVQNILYLMMEYHFSFNGVMNWNTNDAETLIVIAVEGITYNEAMGHNVMLPTFADSFNHLCSTLQAIELKSQQQWQPPVNPGFNNSNLQPSWNQPPPQQWANRVPVQQHSTMGGGMPQQFANNLPQFTNNLPPQNNTQPPLPGAIWDVQRQYWILPAVTSQQPLNNQVGSGFVHYPPTQQPPPARNNLQSGTLSSLAAESVVMREQDHQSTTLYDVDANNYRFNPPEQVKPLHSNSRVPQQSVDETSAPVKQPTNRVVYVNTQLTDSRKTIVMPIEETELAMELADLTKELKEPVLIEINNIKRVTYTGHSYTASTPKETLAELKAKLHEFTLVTEVPQIIKLVNDLKDDFEAKHIADLVCSRVKNTVEVGMVYRYSDTEYKSLPYIEYYKEVGGLFTALGVKDDLDQCVVHMIRNMFITIDLVPYDEEIEHDTEIELLSNELNVPVKDNIDLITLDIPTTTLVLPWVTSYTQSSHKLTVKVGDDVINNLFHQAFSLLPAQILFIDMYDNMHKRYRIYRYGPKMLTGSIYHIEKFIE